MPHSIDFEQSVPLPRERVFAFFGDVRNLQRLTPPAYALTFRGPVPASLAVGVVIDYRLRLRGLPCGWRTLISRWEPPGLFVDEQLRGPYRRWVHTHHFTDSPAGTTIHDHIEYALPFGPLGDLAAGWVRRELTRLFAFRREAIHNWAVTAGAGG